ncbi:MULTISPECIES: stage V sporulation protein AB [Halobacillus]|uniref:Stage V sporulation protein AB n=1 Tax=Halobacillus alkaliphilus TaxID=396056 RepID=A0A1I2K8W6_9BACI|nr:MULTISPECIES: stage V sporulation protein AB [Halobacillus]MCA1009528.1 stage V sporulation protein AB [Halobacillus halophilus]SFF62738.1 stage V sporulation protein AB [Halobacillus alkaliphilus]
MQIIEALIGLASGIAVGTGFVAFLTVLGIVPRLMQLSHSESKLRLYEAAVILGVFFGIYLSFGDGPIQVSIIGLVIWGLFHGIFIGMLAAALTEVLNVFPLLFKRVGVDGFLFTLLMALVLGKIAGSLFQWLIFVR